MENFKLHERMLEIIVKLDMQLDGLKKIVTIKYGDIKDTKKEIEDYLKEKNNKIKDYEEEINNTNNEIITLEIMMEALRKNCEICE